jgi:hypothetical protein
VRFREPLSTWAGHAKDDAVTALLRLLAIAPIALLAACASSGDYPSLAQRPAERVEGTLTPVSVGETPTPPPAPSADLVERLADLRREASARHAEFTTALPAAQRLANAAGATGSDSWASAQVALADLDSLRSRAAVSLADLDNLWVDATLDGGARDAIGAVRSEVESLVRQEDEALARLRARVG